MAPPVPLRLQIGRKLETALETIDADGSPNDWFYTPDRVLYGHRPDLVQYLQAGQDVPDHTIWIFTEDEEEDHASGGGGVTGKQVAIAVFFVVAVRRFTPINPNPYIADENGDPEPAEVWEQMIADNKKALYVDPTQGLNAVTNTNVAATRVVNIDVPAFTDWTVVEHRLEIEYTYPRNRP